MALLKLPLELLSQIIEHSRPEGFESLVLSCRKAWEAGSRYLDEHNRLRRRYRHFAYDEAHSPLQYEEDFCPSSIHLLLQIAENPLIAGYIIHANFTKDHASSTPTRMASLFKKVRESEKFLRLLMSSTCLKESGTTADTVIDSVTLDTFEAEVVNNEAYTSMVLLSLLRNATVISLPENWPLSMQTVRKSKELLQSVVREANNPQYSTAGLSNLTSIFPTTRWSYNGWSELSALLPFTRIHGVKAFKAGISRELPEHTLSQKLELPEAHGAGMNVESVELAGVYFDPRGLEDFLTWLPKLQTLKFSYDENLHWESDCPLLDSAAMMTAVEHGYGDRLQNLSFSLHSSPGPSATFVKSMKNFRKLKQVELDMELLSIASHLSTFRGEFSITNPPLGDILPTSVERVSLLVENVWEQAAGLKNLLAEVCAGDISKLPNLKEIVIRTQESRRHKGGSPRRALEKVFGVPVESLGIIPGDITEYTARSNFFLPLNPGLDRSLGSEVIPTIEPPPYEFTPVPSTPSIPERNARISVVEVEDFMPSFMTGWCERYGID